MEQNNISIMIKIASVALEKNAHHLLADYGLTFSQFKILIYLLYINKGPARQIDIESTFAMTNPTVTGILHNLEKMGMVQRLPNPQDKRSKLIVPTEKTRGIAPELWRIRERLDEEFTRMLTDEEKDQLRKLIRKMING